MKKVLLGIMIVLLACCESHHDEYDVFNIEPTIQVHLNTYFLEKLSQLGHNFPYYDIEFKLENLLNNEIGRCTFTNKRNYMRTITIDPQFWFGANDAQREQLIFHEMGHCDLDIGHTHTGIMRPNALQDIYYTNNRQGLIFELFNINAQVSHEHAE